MSQALDFPCRRAPTRLTPNRKVGPAGCNPRTLTKGECTPMARASSHGTPKREPVTWGGKRQRGLYQRHLADATTVYLARVAIDGRDELVKLGARTVTEAIREREALRTDAARGERRAGGAPSTAEVAAAYLADMRSRVGIRDPKRRYAQGTVDLTEQRLRDHVLPAIGQQPIDEVGVRQLRRMVKGLESKGLAPSTITSCITISSGLFRYALKEVDQVRHNPVRDLDRDDRPGTKRQTEPRYLSVEEIDRLLGAMRPGFRAVALLCAWTGLRISEALGLRWCDVDLEAGTITVRGQLGRDGETWEPYLKTTASAAEIPLLPAALRELKEHRRRQAEQNIALVGREQLVFQTLRGRPQSRRNALRALHNAGDNAGLNGEGREPVGLHDLRHSLIGLAFDDPEITVTEVSAIARHANPRVTLTVYPGRADDRRGRATVKLAAGGVGA